MADPRFFQKSGPFSLAELANLTGATLDDGVDGAQQVSDVAAFDAATASDVSFLGNPK